MSTRHVAARARPSNWLSVVRAVMLRQAIGLVRYPADFAASLAPPFLSLAMAMLTAKAFSAGAVPEGFVVSSGTAAFQSYLTVSILFWTFVDSQLFFGFALLGEMERGTMEGLFASPMPRSAYLTGMALFGFLRTGVNALITLVLALSLFQLEAPHHWPAAAGLTLLNLVMVYGYGLVLAGLVLLVRSGTFTYAWSTVLPLLLGETFSVGILPRPLQVAALAIPLTYGLDALRWAFSGARTVLPLALELAIAGSAALVLPWVGVAFFRWIEGIARKSGSLSEF